MKNTLIDQIKNGKTFTVNENLFGMLKDNFSFNLSLHHPDKVILPLEEFCQFYFKELTDLKFKNRIYRAYNDSISMCLYKLFTPTVEGYESFSQFQNINEPMAGSYLEKALFAKFLSKKYLRSNKSARELLDDDIYREKLFTKEIEKYIKLKN